MVSVGKEIVCLPCRSRVTEREGQMGQFAPGPQGEGGLISKYQKNLLIASLEVFKETPIGAAYKVLRVPPDSVPPDSLAFCPFCMLRSQAQLASCCSFASGPREPLGDPVEESSSAMPKH